MTTLNTVIGLLVLAAFITCIAAGANKCPLWVSVLLLCVIELIRILPLK